MGTFYDYFPYGSFWTNVEMIFANIAVFNIHKSMNFSDFQNIGQKSVCWLWILAEASS